MPRQCVVGGCNNTNREGFKLHHWPKDAKVARNWTKFVQNTRVWGKPTKWSVVCSAHFTDDSYATTEMARMFGYPATLKADAFPTIKSNKSAARPPLNVPKCVSYSGTKELDSTASNGGNLFPQTSELNPLDVLAHTASTEDDQVKNMGPSFPGLLTSTPKLDRSAFRKRERMRVLQDIFSNSYRHSTEEDDYQTFSRAHIGVQIYPDVKSKDVQQPPHIKEEEEDPQPPHIKEEEEEVWMSQEGECPVGQEEADVSKFPPTVVSVKTEEHEDKPPESSQLHHSPNVQQVSAESHEEIPSKQQEWSSSVGQKELQAPSHIKEEQLHDEVEAQSLQLHHSQSEENRGAELVSQHITEADGEHCEDIKSEPDSIFAPLSDMDHIMSHSSDHSDHIQKPLESKNDSKGDHTNNKHLDCSECGKSFKHKSYITIHMRIHTGGKPFTCSVCKKSFSRKLDMTIHMRTHTGEKPFTCSVCKKSFSTKLVMSTHMRTHAGEKPVTCSICKKSFSTKVVMTTHMRTHTGEKPVTCSICKKSFSTKLVMSTHMRTHAGEKPVTCSICKKSFSTKVVMTTHMRTHTGEKPVTCSICKKSFSTKLVMTTHMRTHTGEKPVTCSICKKSFSRKQYMTKHMRTHTGENPLSCTVCDKRFRYKYQVSKHKCATVMEAAGI
ncbi:zinc finger protein 583-like isoform X2 [Nerophis ophidion]|uniref:zinc finger protein 583-like isoform X2 n=1 Tax=Nerophis ophidion TaxID=159077 RepID=UPI002ADF56DE|nr:zinc finger protein 583-like isoform X2 [Nerophis ophidion]